MDMQKLKLQDQMTQVCAVIYPSANRDQLKY